MGDKNEYDWIFDYTLQFLESEKFDAAIMDFVDDKCVNFEPIEENKLIYTDIHNEFCEYVENLVESNLGEVGITVDIFFESCRESRNSRSINKTVFERLSAMEDFQTFKKVMVRRNIELQLEAMQSFGEGTSDGLKSPGRYNSYGSNNFSTPSSDNYIEDDIDEDKLQEILQQSLYELELLHRETEYEQLELERAISLSLALEEERIRSLQQVMMIPDQNQGSLESSNSQAKSGKYSGKVDTKISEDKDGSKSTSGSSKSIVSEDKSDITLKQDSKSSSSVIAETKDVIRNSSSGSSNTNSSATGSKLGPSVLPPIQSRGGLVPMREQKETEKHIDTFYEKKALIENTIQANQDQFSTYQRHENLIKSQISTINPEEIEKRSKFMLEQRNKIIAMKKNEREKKVREEEKLNKNMTGHLEVLRSVEEAVTRVQGYDSSSSYSSSANTTTENSPLISTTAATILSSPHTSTSHLDSKYSPQDIENEKKRQNIRLALARRMRLDLINNNDNNTTTEGKNAYTTNQQYTYIQLDKQLQEAEILRNENIKKEKQLIETIQQQQQQLMTSNIQKTPNKP